jgi:hypothetical protein
MVVLLATAACGSGADAVRFETSAATSTPLPSTTATTVLTTVAAPATTIAPRPRPTAAPTTAGPPARPNETIEVAYRIEVRTADPAGANFPAVVEATLTDGRGWQRANFRLVRRDDAPHRVILADPADAQQLCQPYDVYSKYSCQNGPLVVINAERWRDATPEWTGDLASYRQMVVNHEFGHLLGQHHPKNHCPVRGQPAAIMSQQSTELNGCLPNPWPLAWEIELAARHHEPLAPPYSR